MRATEFIRGILDIIDGLDNASTPSVSAQVIATANEPNDINHFKQIIDLINNEPSDTWENEPNEKYADIAAVTTDAGGGINGPKHPDDLRGNSFRIYPKGE